MRTVRLTDRRPGEPAAEEPVARNVAGYAIEKDVPLPKPRGHKSPIIEAILALNVGESLVHESDSHSWQQSKRVKRSGRTFTARAIGKGSFRIWRIT